MAFESLIVNVYEGPSRWDALLSSVWEGKSIRFCLVKKKIVFPGQSPSEWMWARIMGADRTGERRRNSSTCDQILIRDAEILMPSAGMMVGLVLNGPYDMHTRKGTFTVSARGYEGGDFTDGWKPGTKELVTGLDLVSFLDK